jgi:hypothetical protein
LPVELEHRAHWAIKSWNVDVRLADKNRQKQIAKLEDGERRHTIVPSFIRKEPKDGMITESCSTNSSKETRSCSSIKKSSYSVKENCEANGKDRTPSSTLHHMARSPSKMMTVTYLKSTVNV